MENSIGIFKETVTGINKNTVYVTDEALSEFLTMRDILENIMYDLATLITDKSPFTPGNLRSSMQFIGSIEKLEDFLKKANKNSAESASRVIDAKDIVLRFDRIKSLMNHPNTNRHFREDAIQLFLRIGNLYPEEQIREFISYLDEAELQYILQIVSQEETLIEKPLTGSILHILVRQRIMELKAKSGSDREEER